MRLPSLVAMWRERHRGDLRGQRLAAHDEMQLGAGPGGRALDVAHGDRSVDARPEAAGGDGPDGAPVRRRDRGALAGGGAALRLQSDPHPRRTLFQLALDAGRAGEAALLPAPLLDRPGEPRLDRRRGRVDVVAAKAEARLEAERVARP